MQFKPRRTEGASGNGRLTASAASRAPGVAGVLQTFGKPEYRGIRSDRPSSSKLAGRPLRRTDAIKKPVSIIEALSAWAASRRGSPTGDRYIRSALRQSSSIPRPACLGLALKQLFLRQGAT